MVKKAAKKTARKRPSDRAQAKALKALVEKLTVELDATKHSAQRWKQESESNERVCAATRQDFVRQKSRADALSWVVDRLLPNYQGQTDRTEQ
jgi:hypothetical protein